MTGKANQGGKRRREDAPPARKTPANEKRAPKTLSELFDGDGGRAAGLVTAIAKRAVPMPGDAELAVALDRVAAQPALLATVADLARAAAQLDHPGVRTRLLAWCAETLRAHDPALRDWARDLEAGADAVRELVAWAKPLLADKEAKARGEAALSVGLCHLLRARIALDPVRVLRMLRPLAGGRAASPEQARAEATGLLLKLGVRPLSDVVLAVAAADAEIAEAQADRAAAWRVAEERREKLQELTAAVEAGAARLGAAEAARADAEARAAGLQRELDAARRVAAHDLADSRARCRTFVDEKIAPLVADAIDALDGAPPYPDVALERLRLIQKRIADEVRCLSSPSE
ncbi:hypothetical protein [Azospirillum argentinense]